MLRAIIKRALIKSKVFPLLRDFEQTINAHRRKVHEKDFFLLPESVNEGCIADIGANIGQSMIPFGRLFPNSPIISFEPNSSCMNTLRKVAKILGGNIEIKNCGLGENSENLDFYVPVINETELLQEGSFDEKVFEQEITVSRIGEKFSLIKNNIDVIKLDDLKKDFSLIKIDTQGLEYQVLRGAIQTINKSRPATIIEKDYHSNEKVYELMQRLGYVATEGCINTVWVHCESKFNFNTVVSGH